MTGLKLLRPARNALILAMLLSGIVAPNAGACGRDTDCVIGERSYRIVFPEGHDGTTPIGAIVFAHGYRGTASGVMRNKGLTALASELGIAFIAARAAGPEWNIPNVPSFDALEDVNELAYFDALIEDVVERFAIDRSRILASGFSSGAMMVWHLACYRGDAFAGFAPMSGTFWEPIPETCPTGPISLIHYHGKDDPVVPLHGRPIKDAHQGDIYEAIALIAGLGDFRPIETMQTTELDCARQTDSSGHILELCLFPGKHQLKARYLARAAQIFGVSEAPR